MRKRTIGILLGLFVVASVALAAFLGGDETPSVALNDTGSGDQVTIYESGLAQVELERTFDTAHDRAFLGFSAPATTVSDSVRVDGEGVNVLEVRASPSLDGPVQPGDEVRVHVADETYEGVLVDRNGGQVVLAVDGSTTVVNAEKVRAIEVPGRDLAGQDADADQLSVLADLASGAHEVTVRYLAQGPSWSANYHLDLANDEDTFYASLSDLHTWENVSLSLVAGQPHVVTTPDRPGPSRGTYAEEGAAHDGGGGGEFSSASSLGELHRYDLDRRVNLTQGEQLRLPVREDAMRVEDTFQAVEASTGFGDHQGAGQDVPVETRHEVANRLDEPLPGGVVRLHNASTWVGEDRIDPIPVGETANVTSARSTQVDASLRLTSLSTSGDTETRTYELRVENHETTDPVDVRLQLSYPSYRTNLVSTSPQADEALGTTAFWSTTLGANEASTFALTYEQSRR
jgi:hypothetical protein